MRAFLILVAVATAAVAAATLGGGAQPATAAIPGCGKAALNLVEEGQLSIGTDNPAFPPWFGGGEKTKPWKINDPHTGKGFESAVA
jgi:polar amino acid transport system substrate-binding protein